MKSKIHEYQKINIQVISKRIITICAAILMTASIFAQTPEKMSYQAVIRDSADELVTNTQVGMQISILQGTTNGSAVYVETQTPTSNANGLVSLEIGAGTTSDDFTTIDWANGTYFIKTETDPLGGTTYSITGTSQLMSVPYALYAKESGSSTPGPAGEDGEDGVGITSTTDNGDGTFTLNFSDDSDFTTSDLTGPQNTDTYTKSEVDNLIAGLQSQIDDFHPPVNYDVTASDSSNYTFNGGGFTDASDPDLTLERGKTYTFTVDAPGHPFYINTVNMTGTSNAYTSGVTNNGTSDGTIKFTIPQDAPNTLYYNCQFHSSMNGTITITD